MRGQSSIEMFVLLGALLVALASLFYLAAGDNEMAVIMSAARVGAENAIGALDAEYGCEIAIEQLGFDAGDITIQVVVMGGPPPDNQTIAENIREGALKHIYQAVVGFLPESAEPVRTGYNTYDVAVEIKRVTK